MMRQRFLPLAFLTVLLLAGEALAATGFDPEAVKALSGRNVLLLVGPPESTKARKSHYHDLLKRAGADLTRYPVYQTAALPSDVGARLGIGKRGSNYGALVRWGDPARFGPARILGPGVISELSTDGDLFVLVEAAIMGAGQQALLSRLPSDLEGLRPRPQLAIEQVDFQANGKPVYLVDTKVRLKNDGKVAAKDVTVVFLVENGADGSWYELGRHSGLEIKAGQTITRDLVRTTHDTPLLDANKAIQPTKYRIKVEFAGGALESTDQFTPMLLEDQD
jgi:hypothetical protein